MEMLVHFRDNPATIKKIVSFIEEKGMQIYNNFQGYCFTPNELTALRLTTEEDLLSRYSYNLLDKKIEVEAQYSHMFLQAVSLMYAIHYLKSCASLNEVARVNVLSYLGRDIFNELKDEYMTQLIDSLRAGYGDNNKSQQYLKQKYMELLTQN